MDGVKAKSLPGKYATKVAPQLQRFGGAIGSWSPSDLRLPETRRRQLHGHALSGNVAVPDDADRKYAWRVVYVGFPIASHGEYWLVAASTDMEDVCVP